MKPGTIVPCRFCQKPLTHTFVDLGMSPVANDYVKQEDALRMEPFYPLHTYICAGCRLVQLPTIRAEDEIFREDYAYFSSYSSSWLAHAKQYVEMMAERYTLTKNHFVMELASNDGYLLQYFVQKNIPVLGIEPSKSVAEAAIAKGIPTQMKFFGVDTAEALVREKKQPDVLIGNNVLAHVPDLNDFVRGMKIVLKKDGIITMEFPHLFSLMSHMQFDTIYHEHYSYFSFLTVSDIFHKHGLTVFDVDEIPTHGGSLRIFASHTGSSRYPVTARVAALAAKEKKAHLDSMKGYAFFSEAVKEVKWGALEFFIQAKRQKKTIAGYGAPAKGNTFLNYVGIGTETVDYTVDASPSKQGTLLPGSRIPVFSPSRLRETKPDYVLILPWNLRDEIQHEHSYIKEWGGRFVTAIPKITIY